MIYLGVNVRTQQHVVTYYSPVAARKWCVKDPSYEVYELPIGYKVANLKADTDKIYRANVLLSRVEAKFIAIRQHGKRLT